MSEVTKHTPGPWFLEGNWGTGKGKLGGWVSSFPPAGAPVFELRPVVGSPETIISNAHLIAAAPELLEALHKIGYAPPEGPAGPTLSECVQIARAAIAKAEDRS